jgi:lipoprotein-anchoring transpeptidase ErfK/SrfK
MTTPRSLTRRQFVLGAAGITALAAAPTFLRSHGALAAGQLYVVTTDGLRLRSGPGLSYGVLAHLAKGTTVELLAWAGTADGYNWAKVSVPTLGLTGYVAAAFLAAGTGSTPPPTTGGTFPIGSTVYVSTSSGGSANMRAGPGLSYTILAVLAAGTTGTVQSGETAADGYRWLKVTMGGSTGWMATIVLATGTGSTTELLIDVNLTTQYMVVYRGSTVIGESLVSTGRPGYETPTGTFSILRKLTSETMSGPGFYYPDVPWVMYFTNNGHAIHGAYWHTNFGTPGSGGCVNVPVSFGEWLYGVTPLGTKVRIHY